MKKILHKLPLKIEKLSPGFVFTELFMTRESAPPPQVIDKWRGMETSITRSSF